jgi:rod shape determining protein RodA
VINLNTIQSNLSFRDKLFAFDYILVLSILVLGIVSMFAMYSTGGGSFDYHTQSHIIRFGIFFLAFFIVSFFQIRFWYQTSTLIYLFFFILLLGVKYFGLTSSGSQRWINFYFMNLQPSELITSSRRK